jgi:hypothetical protein
MFYDSFSSEARESAAALVSGDVLPRTAPVYTGPAFGRFTRLAKKQQVLPRVFRFNECSITINGVDSSLFSVSGKSVIDQLNKLLTVIDYAEDVDQTVVKVIRHRGKYQTEFVVNPGDDGCPTYHIAPDFKTGSASYFFDRAEELVRCAANHDVDAAIKLAKYRPMNPLSGNADLYTEFAKGILEYYGIADNK